MDRLAWIVARGENPTMTSYLSLISYHTYLQRYKLLTIETCPSLEDNI